MFMFDNAEGASETIASIVTSTFIPSGQSPAAAIGLLQRRGSSGSLSLSRAGLVWTTTVAVSLLLLQWIGNNREKKTTTPLDWVTRFLSQFWTEPSSSKTATQARSGGGALVSSHEKNKEDWKDRKVILNRGSCHCGSITFKLKPARQVIVVPSPQSGKLQYPTARVPSDQLQLITGKHLWNTYHVRSEDGDIWAYSFCKQCAIHLLHATDADQSSLFVNLQCFNVEMPTEQGNNNNNDKQQQQQQNQNEDDSVAGKHSVVSTVTAATQKSFMTTGTSLPEYANPRLFANQQRRPSNSNDSGSDSAAPIELPPRPKRRNRLPPSNNNKLSLKSSSSSFAKTENMSDLSLPRGVIAYTPTSTTAMRYSSSNSSKNSSSNPQYPSFATPGGGAPSSTLEWPMRNDETSPNKFDEEPDENSISSHSTVSREGLDYPSTSTMEGHTAASTAANSTASSSMDYNVTLNRERLLLNMRKHLKTSPTKRSEPPTTTQFD